MNQIKDLINIDKQYIEHVDDQGISGIQGISPFYYAILLKRNNLAQIWLQKIAQTKIENKMNIYLNGQTYQIQKNTSLLDFCYQIENYDFYTYLLLQYKDDQKQFPKYDEIQYMLKQQQILNQQQKFIKQLSEQLMFMTPLVAQPQNSWLTSQTSFKLSNYTYKLCYLSRKLQINTLKINDQELFTADKQELQNLPYFNRSESSLLTYFGLDSAFALYPCDSNDQAISILHCNEISKKYLQPAICNTQLLTYFYQALKQSGLSDQISLIVFGIDENNFICAQAKNQDMFYSAIINGNITSVGINKTNSLLTQKQDIEQRRSTTSSISQQKDYIQFYNIFRDVYQNQMQHQQYQSQDSVQEDSQNSDQIQILQSQSQQINTNIQNSIEDFNILEKDWKKQILEIFGNKHQQIQQFKDIFDNIYLNGNIFEQNRQIRNINYELFKNIDKSIIFTKQDYRNKINIDQIWQSLDYIQDQYIQLGQASECATFIFIGQNFINYEWNQQIIKNSNKQNQMLQSNIQNNENILSSFKQIVESLQQNQNLVNYINNQYTNTIEIDNCSMAIHFANCTFNTFKSSEIDINESMLWIFNFGINQQSNNSLLIQLEQNISKLQQQNYQKQQCDRQKLEIIDGFIKNYVIIDDIEILQNKQQVFQKYIQNKSQNQIEQKFKQLINIQVNPFGIVERMAISITRLPIQQQLSAFQQSINSIFDEISQATDIMDLDNIHQNNFNIMQQTLLQQNIQYIINLKRALLVYQNEERLISYVPQTFDQVKQIYNEYDKHEFKNFLQYSITMCIRYHLLEYSKNHDINEQTFMIQFIGYLQQILDSELPINDKCVTFELKKDQKLFIMPTPIAYPFDNKFIQLLIINEINNFKQISQNSSDYYKNKIIQNYNNQIMRVQQFINSQDQQYFVYQLNYIALKIYYIQNMFTLIEMYFCDQEKLNEQLQKQLDNLFLDILNKQQNVLQGFSPQQETNQIQLKHNLKIQQLNDQQFANIQNSIRIIKNIDKYVKSIVYMKGFLDDQAFNYNDAIIMLNDLFLADEYQREILYNKIIEYLEPHVWQMILSSVAPARLYCQFKDFKFDSKRQTIEIQTDKCLSISVFNSDYSKK